MMLHKRIGLIVLTLLVLSNGYAAYLKNVPQKITQPDGTIIHCFASGDEFHNWLHDSAGYTIIQNPQTGYYVYATLLGEELIASEHIVGQANPVAVGLRPEMNISHQAWQAKREEFEANIPVNQHKSKTSSAGKYTNLVFFICFADQTGFTTTPQQLKNMYNDSSSAAANSMYNYYRTASYGKVFLNSHFFPALNDTIVLFYRDIYTRDYYSPVSATNTNGYSSSNKTSRKEALLRRVIESLRDSVPTSIILDNVLSGYIDNVSFVVAGSPDGWNDLLWPHRSWYSSDLRINNKRVLNYNFLLESRTNPGVITHEMMHSLGAPDLYRYYDKTIDPVGNWDLMATTNDACPQGLSAYMKYQYGGWIDPIPEITTPGTYTLYPVNGTSPDRIAYKIPFNPTKYPSNQYIILEYRKQSSCVFEESLPGSGILFYRINDSFIGNGNYNGSNTLDEVYIYRPGGTSISSPGNIDIAFFSASGGLHNRTRFGSDYNPYPFYSNGTPIENLRITNITAPGDSIQFTIEQLPYTPVNIKNAEIKDIKIYPNPTQNQLTIENEQLTIENIAFYDVLGRMLQTETVNLKPKIAIDVSHFPAGIYVLKITTKDKRTYNEKIVIE